MANFFNKFKNWIGIEEEEDKEYLYDDLDKYHHYEESTQTEPDYSTSYDESSQISSYMPDDTSDRRKRSNVVSMNRTHDRVKINIHEPITFDDAPEVIDDLLREEVAILNIEMLEKDLKKNIFDFVSGGVYALEATIQKVTKNIFVIAPKGVSIDGNIKDQIKAKGYYQL